MKFTFTILTPCFILLVCVAPGLAKLAPDFIHPCNDTKPESLISASQDAVKGFAKGVPDLGVPALDPFHIDELVFSLTGLNVTLTNTDLHGLGSCIIDDMNVDLVKRLFHMSFHCNLTAEGTYAAEGKLLTFPILGGGHAKVTLTNLKMNLDIDTKYTKDKQGLHHFSLKKYNYTVDYGDNVHFELEDLLKGNKEMSAKILEVMNKESKLLAEDIGPPIVAEAVKMGCTVAEKFFAIVPYEELINVPFPED